MRDALCSEGHGKKISQWFMEDSDMKIRSLVLLRIGENLCEDDMDSLGRRCPGDMDSEDIFDVSVDGENRVLM